MSAANKTFKIGLAMAGAVSAGAYSAGVLDFLLDALDAWYAAKARGERVPQHDIALDVASGASAGAMCSALLVMLLPYRFPHVRIGADYAAAADRGDPAMNLLYRAWVSDIGIEPLLDTGDLQSGQLDALLNCGVIDDIVKASLAYAAPLQPRPYVTQPFVARFTLGNLRGVPYAIGFLGDRASNEDAMTEHADYRGFLLGGEPQAGQQPDWLRAHLPLPAQSIADPPQWRMLGDAAVASGAFPLFLKPRLIQRPVADYNFRQYVQSSMESGKLHPIPPAWDDPPPQSYAFASVDGGVFDNEPFELAHEIVAGGPGMDNARQPELASAAVLMINPFMALPGNGAPPLTATDPVTGLPRLLLPPQAQIMPLLNALLMQSQFKPADLVLAYDETVYSRFIIAPSASNSPPAALYWIASGALGGFLGFFHEDFRKHDYQLGRRNCQQFLQQHFSLPAANEIVAQGYAGLLDDPAEIGKYRCADGQLPIIPLVGAVRAPETLLPWPAGRWDPASVMPAVDRRLDAVFAHYRKQIAAASPWPARLAISLGLKLGWSLIGRKKLHDAILTVLSQAKTQQQL